MTLNPLHLDGGAHREFTYDRRRLLALHEGSTGTFRAMSCIRTSVQTTAIATSVPFDTLGLYRLVLTKAAMRARTSSGCASTADRSVCRERRAW